MGENKNVLKVLVGMKKDIATIEEDDIFKFAEAHGFLAVALSSAKKPEGVAEVFNTVAAVALDGRSRLVKEEEPVNEQAAEEKNFPVIYNLREGYDHSYFFISSFIENH